MIKCPVNPLNEFGNIYTTCCYGYTAIMTTLYLIIIKIYWMLTLLGSKVVKWIVIKEAVV